MALPYSPIHNQQQLAAAIVLIYNSKTGQHPTYEPWYADTFRNFGIRDIQSIINAIGQPYSDEDPIPYLVCLGSNLITDATDPGENKPDWGTKFPQFEILIAIDNYVHNSGNYNS